MVHDGLVRRYVVAAPSTEKLAYPLIIGLHGGGATPEGFAAVTGLVANGARAGYLVALPAGYGRSWNGGDCCGPAWRRNVDDVGWLLAIVEDLSAVVPLDRRRIYAAGWSNGGKLAMRLACEKSEEIAAIGIVGSGLGYEFPMARPVPLVAFHGTADPFHPYHGGVRDDRDHRFVLTGALATVDRWSQLLGCDIGPERSRWSPSVTCRRYYSSQSTTEAMLFTIDGMGHQWPGRSVAAGAVWHLWEDLGSGTDEIDATAEMLHFFGRHALPGPRHATGG